MYGDPNYFTDETLFFYIGQRMHDGALPYVDVWDRKGPGLLLVYWAIAGISKSVWSYQIAASICAALTAFAIGEIGAKQAGRIGGMLSGTLYLAALATFGGGGGQAAVFFNLPVALGGLIIARHIEARRDWSLSASLICAMMLVGCAITFKQTAVFEGAYFGCYVLWQMARERSSVTGLLRRAAILMIAGALPMLVFALFWFAKGHFNEFWHAMVSSNLKKSYNPGGDLIARLQAFAMLMAILLALGLAGLVSAWLRPEKRPMAVFVFGWLIAAFVGFFSIPNLIDHYFLPVLVPLAVSAAPIFQRMLTGPILAACAGATYLMVGQAFDFADRNASHAEMAAIEARIRALDARPRLFIFDGPVYLYSLVGSHPPSPLVLPLHLFYAPEKDVSHLNTAVEVAKILRWRPTVVVVRHHSDESLRNQQTDEMVETYIKTNCRWRFQAPVRNLRDRWLLDIYGGCGNAPSPALGTSP